MEQAQALMEKFKFSALQVLAAITDGTALLQIVILQETALDQVGEPAIVMVEAKGYLILGEEELLTVPTTAGQMVYLIAFLMVQVIASLMVQAIQLQWETDHLTEPVFLQELERVSEIL